MSNSLWMMKSKGDAVMGKTRIPQPASRSQSLDAFDGF